MNILLLEDDVALNRTIKKILELDRHIVTAFIDGQAVIEALGQHYDLYILDIKVPHISGLELLDLILLQDEQAKVIMISANTDMVSLQTAYDLGCVDYLKKPFYIAELRAKINRLKLSREHLLSSVKLKSEETTLTKKEKRLLTLLLDNQTFVVTYGMIESNVYKNKPMSMVALRTLVRRLRAKLADDIITNVTDQGYLISHIPAVTYQLPQAHAEPVIDSLQQEIDLLKMEKQELIRRSNTDPLTGLYNRVKIHEIFAYEQQQFIRHKEELCVILMDLDDFKSVNDIHGHNVGDNYLQEVARILTEFFRTADTIGRWGGEEFIIFLPRTSLDQSHEIASRLRKKIAAIDCPKIGHQTASFGLSVLVKDDTLNSLVHRADKALYLAKAHGKDRVEVFDLGVMDFDT